MKKVILIDVIKPELSKKDALEWLLELESLVSTYGGFVIIKKIQKRTLPDYETYVWKGKIEEIRQEAIDNWVKLIIINNNLKPKQIFSIESLLEKDWIKVWTRIDLILKIFEKHAVTLESRLQIELAAITQLWPRIFWMWLELSRQWWWIWTRGQWETNTEVMKRHLQSLEIKVKNQLKKVSVRHELHRANRARKGLKTVAIVGYTNAWKSQTLFSLSKKDIKIKNELFATLDTVIWDVYLPTLREKCLVSDTIWFIKDTPPSLINAFKSTLDEAIHADLILHVLDYSDSRKEEKIKVVNEILDELGVSNKPTILVCNKIDLVKKLKTKTFFKKYKRYSPILISALKKEGIKELVEHIESYLAKTTN